MTVMTLVIKGNQKDAFEALSKRGIDARLVGEVKGTTVCEAIVSDTTPVILWSTEVMGRTIPVGTLLNYTENECDDNDKVAA